MKPPRIQLVGSIQLAVNLLGSVYERKKYGCGGKEVKKSRAIIGPGE